MTQVRCAIYTRKSSEEGLEHDFNSLDAQFEACAAYVKSQAGEGWTLGKDRYDDGGITVRHIFQRYSTLANVRLLAEELEEHGIRSPDRLTANGRAFGGRPFSRGQLYKMLSNAIYIGRIEHGARTHQGNHSPIIELTLWEQVQATLAANVNGKRTAARATEQSILAGRLFDDRSMSMVATHACKGKVRYRYYVSRDLQHGGDASVNEGWRIPAREIEQLVIARIVDALRDPLQLLATSNTPMPSPNQIGLLLVRGKAIAEKLAGPRSQALRIVRDLVAEVRVREERVDVALDPMRIAKLLEVPRILEPIHLNIPAKLKRSGLA